MTPYKRKVNYYETDQMSIVHHSNYIRYFEEARIDFMNQIGCNVMWMETLGLIIPNIDAYAKYLVSLKFDEEFEVKVKAVDFTGVRMKFEYEIYRTSDNTLCATGHTSHCFVNTDYKPISVKKSHPEIYKKILDSTKL